MGDSYKEAVVHQAPEVIHVQPGLQPVQPGYEAAPHANLAPAEPRSRRRRFIALVGAGIVVVVVALAVGLGVGLSSMLELCVCIASADRDCRVLQLEFLISRVQHIVAVNINITILCKVHDNTDRDTYRDVH